MKTRLLIATILTPIPSALWWLGGYDFNERGLIAVTLGSATLFCFIVPLTFPE